MSSSDTTSTPPIAASGTTQEKVGSKKSTTSNLGKSSARKGKVKKQPPPGGWPKKKKLSKAERRALQEKQRAAKGLGPHGEKGKAQKNKKSPSKASDAKSSQDVNTEKRWLFSHLPPYRSLSTKSLHVSFGSGDDGEQRKVQRIHRSVLRCGLKMSNGECEGSNTRCKAMLRAFRDFISDFRAAEKDVFKLALDKELKSQIQFLVECRPLSFSMRNTIKWIRHKISQVGMNETNEDAKRKLADVIDRYSMEKIEASGEQIANLAIEKIEDGDVVMTYLYNSTVEQIVRRAIKDGRTFRVVVVDARPHASSAVRGKRLLQALTKLGVNCTYIHLEAVSYAMEEVTKVILGTEAMLSNGVAIGYSGTATVAMVARACKKPVLMVCESYKFCENVQIDSIVSNELGDPCALTCGKSDLTVPRLRLLNLLFDTTPVDFITMVVTEVGLIPASSVPVVIRETQSDAAL